MLWIKDSCLKQLKQNRPSKLPEFSYLIYKRIQHWMSIETCFINRKKWQSFTTGLGIQVIKVSIGQASENVISVMQ